MQTIIVVSSFAFQLSGAVILLLWSLRNIDQKIKSISIENNGIPIIDFNNTTVVSKVDLQKNAKKVYINIAAFLDLVIGYSAAVFAESSSLSSYVVFILVVLATFVIIIIEIFLSGHVAKLRYNTDQRVNIDDMDNKPSIIFRTIEEKNEVPHD